HRRHLRQGGAAAPRPGGRAGMSREEHAMSKANDRFVERFGPWALVTGASSGIGAELARALAARGLHLVMPARRAARLDELAAELRQRHGVTVEVVAVDLARPDFLGPLAAACAERDVGLVVSNAGFGKKGAHHEIAAEELTAMLMVNCHAPM